MTNLLNKYAQNATPSATLEMGETAKTRKASDLPVFDFSLGESCLGYKGEIAQAMHGAIDSGEFRYTPTAGKIYVREAICTRMDSLLGLNFLPSETIAMAGVKPSLDLVLGEVLNPGDKVLLISPYWLYEQMYTRLDVETVVVSSIDDIPAAVYANPTIKVIITNNVRNPDGYVFSDDELKKLTSYAQQWQYILFAEDLIYADIVFNGQDKLSMLQLDPTLQNVVVLYGLSKGPGMAGHRLASIAGPEYIIKACIARLGNKTGNLNIIQQAALQAAYTMDQSYLLENCNIFKGLGKTMSKGLNSIDGLSCKMPDGAMYCWAKVSPDLIEKFGSSQELAMQMVKKIGVASLFGEVFGTPGYLRLCFATEEDIILRGIDEMEKFLKA